MEVLRVSTNPIQFCSRSFSRSIKRKRNSRITSSRCRSIKSSSKAVAIARGFVAPSGIDLVCVPAFADIEIDGEERTAIKLIIESR